MREQTMRAQSDGRVIIIRHVEEACEFGSERQGFQVFQLIGKWWTAAK